MAYKNYYFTTLAENDINEIFEYISIVLLNQTAVEELIVEIQKTIDNIIIFPNMYPTISNEFIKRTDIRKVNIKNYVMYYVCDKEHENIIILRVVYNKRDLKLTLKQF